MNETAKPVPAPKSNMKAKVGTFSAVALLLLLAQFISPSEGGRILDVYLDSAAIPTACMGIIGPEVTRRYQAMKASGNKADGHFTDAECDKLETTYLTRMKADLEHCLTPALVNDLSLGEFLSYGDGAYNFGTGAMCKSPMAKLAAQGKRREACDSIASYRVHTGTPGNRKPRGKGTLTRSGRWLQDCRDPANRCTGLPKRRDRQRNACLAGLPEAA